MITTLSGLRKNALSVGGRYETQIDKFKEHCELWRYDLEVDENDFFVNATTQRAWNIWVASWQAAIESVVVELPEPHQDEWKELNLSTDEVVKAIDDAGVKYVLPETFVRY